MATTSSEAHQSVNTLPVPTGFVPEGVDKALLDANTLYLIQEALPAKYQAIFTHLLYYGTTDPKTTMQRSLFEAIGEGNHEVIILYKSVDALSKSPRSPAGPETYHKGILLYEALKLIRRIFHKGYTEIRISLGNREIHVQALLQSLRQLHIDYRNDKVQQIARKVAKTIRSGEFVTGIPRPSESIDQTDGELRGVLTKLLAEHGINESNIKQATLSETCTVIAQALQATKNGRVQALTGESAKARIRASWTKPGDSLLQPGEFVAGSGTESHLPQDSSPDQKGEFVGKESPDQGTAGRQRRCHRPQKGDLDAIFGKESPEKDEKRRVEPFSGDSLPAVSIIVPYPNVITTKGSTTLIDTIQETPAYTDPRSHKEIQHDAQEYQNRFDKGRGRQWPGSLYNAVKLTPPEVRHPAAIATLFYMTFRLPDGSEVKRPGGLFTKTCERYRQPGAEIPQEIQAWAATGLSLSEIEIQIKNGNRHPAQPQLPFDADGRNDLTGLSLGQEAAATQREDGLAFESYQLERYEVPSTSRRPVVGRSWMDQDEADDLRFRIERERGHYDIEAKVRPGRSDGVFMVLTTWDGAEVVQNNGAEWDDYFTSTRECLE